MEGTPHIFYIDSDNRISGNSSKFQININIPKYCDHVALLQISIPKSFYSIDINLNTFILKEDSTETKITLNNGNYSANEFITELETQLNSYKTDTGTYSVSLSSQTSKITFTLSSPSTTSQALIFDSNISRYMGFNNPSTNNFVSNTLISDNVINLERSKSIYLKSDIVKPHTINNTKNLSESILQEIFVNNSSDYSFIGYQNPYPLINAKPINQNKTLFTFLLCDTDDNIIDLNGVELVFSIICYKRDNYHELKKELIKNNL